MWFSLNFLLLQAAFLPRVLGAALYDEYRDADLGQSGYLPNHNMDPNIVNSAAFGQLWKFPFNTKEQFYAKPLTYTPLAGGNQLLFLASSQNWIRTLDAKTGALINSRQIHTPFLQSDIGCTDIPNYIGIIGTPTIDPATDIVYFYSKTYIPNYRVSGSTGTSNGVYYFHGVNITTLADAFTPMLIDGAAADNAPAKYFVGGVLLQRSSLTQIGSVVYGAFGAHCDLFNYTGLVIGIDVNKAQIVTHWAVESGPLAPQTNSLLQNGGGGEGGIWMAGMGLASDGNRIFFVSGNGQGHENVGAPATGQSGCKTLGEAAVNLGVDSSTGALSVSDYFQPYDYQNMDGGDQDFGSGGIVLLDSTVFSGGGVSKMAITAGKNGKVYVLNANNLGGYRLGAGQTDNVIQTITEGGSIFGAAGSYPLEGGWVYTTPVGDPTFAYQLGFTAAGVPQLSKVAQTKEVSAGRVGVGIPTVTSLNGQAGSAILWMADPDAGLRAWYAVPQNGVLVNIPLPQVGGANKFQRPAFGNGRVYITDSNGVLYCLGSPVSLPLNCTSPVNFGQVALGSKVTQNVTCTALIAINQITGLQINSATFSAKNSSLPTGPLAKGASFTFPATWDLTNANTNSVANASSGDVSPGVKSTPLTILTNNGVAGYSTSFPISLTGTEVSQNPYLSVAPTTLDYGGVVVTDPNNVGTVSGILTISNKGLSAMTIQGYAYTTQTLANDPTYTNATLVNGTWDLGYGFTASNLPAVGSSIAPNTAISVNTVFDPINGTGQYLSYFEIWSSGGAQNVILEGAASTAPIANFSISNGEGGWLPGSELTMDFGSVGPGNSSSRQIRICNQGGSALTIDKSKPPNGVFHIPDPTELEETQSIPPTACAYGTVIFSPNTEEYNVATFLQNNTWTLNTNDLNFGVHVVECVGTVVDKFVGPTNSSGQYVYQYLGCFAESNNGPRLLPNEPLAPSNTNDNANCQNACYGAAQYWFAGTEYGDECYCGNTPPPLASQAGDAFCNFACPGDGNDRCGASGYISIFYDPTKYVAGTNAALYGPQTVQSAGPYVYQGCYSEATNGRALSGSAPNAPSGGFTIELCEAACSGYTYFGMEYSNQCYCGNAIGAGSLNQTTSIPSDNGCSMTCTGNGNEYCGGANRLNLYALNGTIPATTSSSISSSSTNLAGPAVISGTVTTTSSTVTASPTGPITMTNFTGYAYLGCYSEATDMRALNGLQNPVPGPLMSVESCAAACTQYLYFGVEYSQECYCGNVINAGSVNQTSSVPNVNGCNMVCSNNAGEYCGGSNRLNIYQKLSSSSSSTTPSSNTVSAASSSTSSGSPVSYINGTATQSSTSSTSVSQTSSSVSSSATPTQAIATKQAVLNYAYIGCYTEGTNTRALTGSSSYNYTAMTLETCASYCSSYSYWGVEYGGECYCGNTLNGGSALAPNQADCSFACPGNQYEYCGAGNRLEMYQRNGSASLSTSSSSAISSTKPSSVSGVSTSLDMSGSTTSSSSVSVSTSVSSGSILSTSGVLSTTTTSSSSVSSSATVSSSASPAQTLAIKQAIGNYRYAGCYTEGTNTRALSGAPALYNYTAMTLETCATYCSSFNYWAVEYGGECYCGNTLGGGSALALNQADCSFTCPGDQYEYCGAGNRLEMYTLSATSSTSSSASLTASTTSNGASSMSSNASGAVPNPPSGTVVSTTSLSSTTGRSSSSASSSSESTPTSAITSAGSASSASSSSASSLPTASFTSTSSTASTTSSSSSTSTGPPIFTGTPQLNATIGNYQYMGCALEVTGRALSGSSYSSNSMTIESCNSWCTSNNYALSGVEYGTECYCGNGISSASSFGQTGCDFACAGDAGEICGGSSRISVFNNTAYTAPTSPTNSGNYVLQGCYQELKGGRLLSGASYSNSTGMTVESCTSFCEAQGTSGAYAGVEYSEQCFCAASLPSTANVVSASSCDMLCSGNNKEYCGGSGLLDIYLYKTPSSGAKSRKVKRRNWVDEVVVM